MKQKVVINNIEPKTVNIVCGMPQGSILGPLLFLMFLNALPLYTNNVSMDRYADDTTLYTTGLTQDYTEDTLADRFKMFLNGVSLLKFY